MSGYVSPFGNASQNFLYDPLKAQQQTSNENALMLQQQDIGSHEIEMGARLAGTLWSSYPTTEARASAYPTLLAQARAAAPGYFRNAPATYPGDDATQALMRMGTPSADLFKLGVDRTAKGAIAPGDSGTAGTGGGGGGGGGTGTAGGADTAPINAAGDSRTRKAAEGGPPAAGSPGAAVAQQVHDFWIGKGFSEAQVAGIMAGGPGSESDFTPTVFGDKGTSYGLYQHHGPRLDAMRQFFGLSSSQNPTADQQNQYAHWEITQGPLKNVGEMLKNAKTPAEAAAIWTQYFGVPADKSEIGRRAAGAQRFVGLYGQPQQGGPGGATAPAPPPGVQMGGAAPPPPGGAPGAYPAYGGGMGAVIGGQPAAVSGTTVPAGRPTGPPVVTDQPAGSNVVAGPPGVATVGQPVPASPAVAGNVDAINRGIVGAGGRPVTDPNLTPTPARYAGTAPAPSVEAPPEAGWGTGIGSGYGPQNALAPAPVPPAPARPAVPAVAQPAAAQPPAADTLPPLPAPTPPPRRNNNGLTDEQQHDINTLRGTSITSEHLQARVDAYRTANAARDEKYQADQLAYANAVQSRQTAAETRRHTGVEEQRQAEADKRAAAEAARQDQANTRAEEDAARKRAADADPIKGTDEKANADRLLLKYVDGILDGTATSAQRRLYAEAAQYYLKSQMQWIDDPSDPTKKQMVAVPGQLPEGFPHPGFKPGEQQTQAPAVATKTDFKPLPETERKLLIDTATRIDQETQQRNLFKPEYAGFGNAAIGEFANAVARNNPIASKADTARAEWWQNYQRYKLAVRQGVSGQSLTESELIEFDKADIHPGMTAQAVRDNLLQQDKVLRTAHERRVGSLAADRFSPDAIRAASGVDPSKVTVKPLTESGASKPDTAPHPPGFQVLIP